MKEKYGAVQWGVIHTKKLYKNSRLEKSCWGGAAITPPGSYQDIGTTIFLSQWVGTWFYSDLWWFWSKSVCLCEILFKLENEYYLDNTIICYIITNKKCENCRIKVKTGKVYFNGEIFLFITIIVKFASFIIIIMPGRSLMYLF